LGDNWVLKNSNLRKLLRNLEHYYHDALRKDADFDNIDQTAIAKQADSVHLTSLVQLVAAAAVTCPQKADHVRRIMQMTPDNQVAMKGILESSLRRLTDYSDDADDDDASGEENELVFGHDAMNTSADDSHHDDDDPNRRLFATNNNTSHDYYLVQQQLKDAQSQISALKAAAASSNQDHDKGQEKLRALVEDLQDRLVKRQDDLIQVEEDLQKATFELDETKSKLALIQDQNTQLADDLDVANAKAQQLYKAEATVVAYRKKLDSVGVMNQQVTELEDQASSYLRQIVDLENEVKRSAALTKTVQELQQRQAVLEQERAQADASVKSLATELADIKGQWSAAENARKMFQEELRELRAQQESSVEPVVEMREAAAVPSVSLEQREKSMRLEIENRQLQEQIAALQQEVAEAKEEATTAKMATLSVNEEKSVELSAAAAPPLAVAVAASDDEVGNAMVALKEEIQRLREDLDTKEKQNAKIIGDKDKLEAYTKRTLAKFQDKYLVALQECKAKLKEKQDKIEVLEQRSASERTAQKREERLLSSTIYELGLAIMQNRLKSGSTSG
jgi:protein HOOK3